MDAVPYEFLKLVMRILTLEELPEIAQFGDFYSTTAKIVNKEKTLECLVEVPGLFSDRPLHDTDTISDSPEIYDMFDIMSLITVPLRDLTYQYRLTVAADSVFFSEPNAFENAFSLQALSQLMHEYRLAPARKLAIKNFPLGDVDLLDDRFLVIPQFPGYFNQFELQYSESPTFQRFFTMLGKANCIVELVLHDPEAMEYYNDNLGPATLSGSSPTETPPPIWLQEAIVKIFYQPQLEHLTIYSNFSDWASTSLCDTLIWHWITNPETFPKTFKRIHVLGGPSMELIEKYGIRPLKGLKRSRAFPPPPKVLVYQTFFPSHPQASERSLTLRVYSTNVLSNKMSTKGFCSNSRWFYIVFSVDHGQKIKYLQNRTFASTTNFCAHDYPSIMGFLILVLLYWYYRLCGSYVMAYVMT
ncbi:hypothetical protein QR680_007351 [Steinernema hermaphroditum]|uniref:Uncharacterized protein n=1 Tax=Steinernema hermaphroditum TaxID=289476 RepID=A0AA39ICX0_9BILA|nr:hypothetical protein QR680_007351 [Steinernema hermaphroditum]